MPITVRYANVNDLTKINEIEKECFTIEAFSEQQLLLLLHNPDSISLVAQVGKEIVGFIIGQIRFLKGMKIAHIYTIDVAIKHRRKRVGETLLAEIEQLFIKEGAKVCYLEARQNNIAALELYKKQGYTVVERLSDYYSEGLHGVRLEKWLSK